MNKGHHTSVNGVFFRLEKESESIHRSLKKSWQTIFGIKKRAAETAAQVNVRMLPLLDGGWSEALRQQCFADPYLCGKFLNEPLEQRLPKRSRPRVALDPGLGQAKATGRVGRASDVRTYKAPPVDLLQIDSLSTIIRRQRAATPSYQFR
jgi:hypothetical protein